LCPLLEPCVDESFFASASTHASEHDYAASAFGGAPVDNVVMIKLGERVVWNVPN